MTTLNISCFALATLALSAWSASAFAQPGADQPLEPATPGPAAKAPAGETALSPPTPPAAPEAAPNVPVPAAPNQAASNAIKPVFPPPVTRPPPPRRQKALRTTVGMDPAAVDFGAEADIVSSVGRPKQPPDNRRWTYALRGFLRAPMRIGIGPETGKSDGSQLHSPPRIVGFWSDEWTHINVAPGATGQLQLAVTNPRVEGHVIIAADSFVDAGYPHLDKMGGFSQAWVTLKSPALFDIHGGIALNVGAFSERFGAAGPYQQSTGYYGTYLFGRTHVAGESLVLNVDLSEKLELTVEHGFGAKVEVVPFRKDSPPILPYLPNQGPTPQGSNFVHHAHASLQYADWLTVAAHYLTSWSPNDLEEVTQQRAKEARLTIAGGEVHIDHPVIGHGYLGYSYVDAKRILPLADGIQVIHGSTGLVFKENYFGALPERVELLLRQGQPAENGRDDSGTVQNVLFQYLVRASSLLGWEQPGPDVSLAVFGMLSQVEVLKQDLNEVAVPEYELKQSKLKLGAELQYAPIEMLSVGLRADRVMPDGGNADVAYSALSPRVVLHSKWIGREYVILNYTRYFLGSEVRPSVPYTQPDPPQKPYDSITEPDGNLLSLTAMVAF